MYIERDKSICFCLLSRSIGILLRSADEVWRTGKNYDVVDNRESYGTLKRKKNGEN